MSTATAAPKATSHEFLFANYKRVPVAFSHGEGVRLWDRDGKSYLDFLAGIATSSLGHNHPALVQAVQEQVAKYIHVSNLYEIPEQAQAAKKLIEATRLHGYDALARVFFCNSGAEANEGAIKLARRWAWQNEDKPEGAHEIVVMENGFHGRTMGALAATGTPAYHEGFAPMPGGFVSVPYGDLDAAQAAFSEKTCAVLVEPIQGEAGVITTTPEYLQSLQQLCRQHNALFVLDEVQTGFGRTGHPFGFQGLGLEPDVLTLAKGMGGGVPVGAIVATEAASSVLVPGTHGSTFGGTALASVAAQAVLDTILAEGFLDQVQSTGERLRAGLRAIGERTGRVTEVRGAGLMVACEITPSAPDVVLACVAAGFLLNAPRPHSVRFLPPLVVSPAEVDEALQLFESVLEGADVEG